MNVFGLTPLDTALSVAGLNVSQLLMDWLFTRKGLLVIVGILAYFLVLWKIANKGKYNQLFFYVSLIITFVILLFPSRTISEYKSAQEAYGQTPSISSQCIKANTVTSNKIPSVYSFISQGVDAYVIAAIAKMDSILPEWGKFLSSPFQLQRNVLYINEDISLGFTHIPLKEKFHDFIVENYIPALTRLHHQKEVSLVGIGPYASEIQNTYSPETLNEWRSLEREITTYFESHAFLSASARRPLSQLMNITDDELKRSLITSYAHAVIDKKSTNSYQWLSLGFSAIFIMMGLGQMFLAVISPFILLAVLLTVKPTYFWQYMRNFIWVKLWPLCAALASAASLLIGRMQANQMTNIGWGWEYPYFSVVGFGVFLILVVLTGMTILRG